MNEADVSDEEYMLYYRICEEALYRYWPIQLLVSVGVCGFVGFTQYGASGISTEKSEKRK